LYFSRNTLLSFICFGLLYIVSNGVASAQTDYLYVTDYGAGTDDPAVGGNMDRYQFTYNSGTNTITNFTPYGAGGNTSNAVFITGGIKEGVQGTDNDIIAVATGGASLNRYNFSGSEIGSIAVTLNGSPYTFNTVGNIVLSPDGQYVYVPEQGAGLIDKVSLATGAIVAQVNFPGAHDLLLVNGTLYAAAYSGYTTGVSDGIWTFNTSLASAHQMVLGTAFGSATPTGMSFSGTTLYVNGNIPPTSPGDATVANSVFEFNIPTPGGTAATLINSYSSSNLSFIFGNSLGPDGNLYIAGLGGASGRTDDGYTDGVYEFNTTSNAVSLLVGGESGTSTTGPPGSSGLYSPKYLQFSPNFIAAPDAGFSGPEPGAIGMFCSMGVAGAGWFWRRKKRGGSHTPKVL